MAATETATCVFLAVIVLTSSFQINLLDYATTSDIEDEDSEGIPSSNYCSDNYPYTFSKCLRLCSTDLTATCLDDQLCYCNKDQAGNIGLEPLEASSLNSYLGANMKASCQFSHFCEDLCQYDERLSELVKGSQGTLNSTTGALCKIPEMEGDYEIESCVCGLE